MFGLELFESNISLKAKELPLFLSGRQRLLLLDALFMSPMVLPAMAFGLSLLLVFNILGVRLSIATLVLGHTIVCWMLSGSLTGQVRDITNRPVAGAFVQVRDRTNVIIGTGDEIGPALVAHPLIGMISLTGDTDTGSSTSVDCPFQNGERPGR